MLGCRSHQRGQVGLGCGLSRGQEDSEVGSPQAALRWLEGQDGVLRSCQDRAGSDCRYIESQHLPGLGGSELPDMGGNQAHPGSGSLCGRRKASITGIGGVDIFIKSNWGEQCPGRKQGRSCLPPSRCLDGGPEAGQPGGLLGAAVDPRAGPLPGRVITTDPEGRAEEGGCEGGLDARWQACDPRSRPEGGRPARRPWPPSRGNAIDRSCGRVPPARPSLLGPGLSSLWGSECGLAVRGLWGRRAADRRGDGPVVRGRCGTGWSLCPGPSCLPLPWGSTPSTPARQVSSNSLRGMGLRGAGTSPPPSAPCPEARDSSPGDKQSRAPKLPGTPKPGLKDRGPGRPARGWEGTPGRGTCKGRP